MTFIASAEREWLVWLAEQPDPIPALRLFATHYHFFSLRQVIAFTGLFRRVSPTDRESLASLGEVLHEELGGGNPRQVHSILFERFARAVGVDIDRLPLSEHVVAPGIRAYVDTLFEIFDGESAAAACAAYVFLESSAVETYQPLLATLTSLGIHPDALEFFARHAQVEPGHKEAAEAIAGRYVDDTTRADYEATIARLAAKWNGFWRSVAEMTTRA